MFGATFKGSPVSNTELLGTPLNPPDCTLARLQEAVPAIASGIVEGDSDKILAELGVEFLGREWEVWPHVMSRWLYRYFDDLKSFDNYTAVDAAQIAKIKEQNPQLEKKPFLSMRADRRTQAYTMCCTMLSPEGRLATESNAVSLQMAANRTGSPFYPDNAQVKYQKAPICPCDKCCYKCCTITRTVGGGFVESFAFGGEAPNAKGQMGGQGVKVGAPAKPFALPYMAGMSSWAPGGVMDSSAVLGELGNLRQKYWPVTSPHLPKAQKALMYEFGDGGLIDNSGVLCQLQRGAPKFVWIATAWSAFSTTYDWANATVENFDPIAAGVVDQLYVLFGYNTTSEGYFYANDQVFEKDLLLPMCKELRALALLGKPAVLKKTMRVLPNEWWGIVGNCEVEYIIIYLQACQDFQKALPAETQAEIAKGSDGMFNNFPIYSTTGNNSGDALGLTTPQVNLLAAQAQYSVVVNAALFNELLGSYPDQTDV